MEIRRLNGGDAESYRSLRHEALIKNPEAFSSSYEDEMYYEASDYGQRLDSKFTYTFGAFNGRQLVGVVTLVPEGKVKIRHRANIFAMYVTPSQRGNGTGRLLMKMAIQQATELTNVEQIYLTVNASNEPAKKLYASLGFEIYGIDKKAMVIDGTYHDEELMVLFL
ncbi:MULTISPECIES: GNAT family N-acetyltransferase [unclassified Bacillus (in: firmicutes)]|jgi:ribosomal protein S18 acetylase RimI-like enzyme|uniref:GNAT family N-acetyltransferase n=1 Tax=unclassified Bacillus (in: firmicutes) TaxID=185979 RepID=UPI001BE60496|nr:MULTISPECIES: GNAT family N-acetyltransferase [unclassified Bacillus (in: firmicutes)]MBT2685143.1 GNAT family N-acetyltransferase [Bacillus sp. ISL-37]MBT2693999.1 GNAT family N-acetyltransferase [Bacillus sp. ISL-55]